MLLVKMGILIILFAFARSGPRKMWKEDEFGAHACQ